MTTVKYFASLCFLFSSVVCAEQLDLLSAYDLSKKNYENLEIAYQNTIVAEQNKKGGTALLLPQLSLSLSNQNNTIGSTSSNTQQQSLILSQSLYNYDNIVVNDKLDIQVNVSEVDYRQALQNLIMNTATLYFDILQSEITLKSHLSNLDFVSKNLEVVENQYQAYDATNFTLAEASAAKQQLLSNIQASHNEINSRKLSLLNHIDVPGNLLLKSKINVDDLEKLNISETREVLLDLALKNNTNLQRDLLVEKIREKDVKIAKASYYPKVNLQGSYTNHRQFTDKTISLELSVPIFTGFKSSADLDKSQSMLEIAKLNISRTKKDIKQKVFTNYDTLLFYKSRVKILANLVELREKESAFAQKQLAANDITFSDVLRAEKNYWGAVRDYEQVINQYILGFLMLKKVVGTLSAEDVELVNSLFM